MSRRTARLRSLEDASGFVDRVGLALLFPKPEIALPSLWEAISGSTEIAWAVREDGGKFVEFTPEFASLWQWKDELPARRLACVGKHVARTGSLVAPRLVATLYSLTGRVGRPDDFRDDDELTTLQREIAEAILENGACSRPELRDLLADPDSRRVESAVQGLQRRLVLTNVGVVEQAHGWPATKVDLLVRHWRARMRRLPDADHARLVLARTVLESAGELSAVDLAAALAWRRPVAASALDQLAERGLATARDEEGYRLWSWRQPAAAASRRGAAKA